VDADWTELAYLGPHGSDVDPEGARAAALDAWCAERGINRDDIPEDALIVRLHYLGPGKGCAEQIMINESAIPSLS
jgi:hypothetical protein